MKDMNVPTEVNSRLKQLKNSVEVENNKKQNENTTTDSLKSRFVYNGCGSDITFKSRFIYGMCGKSKRLICSFVYNVCGYHLTPIPHQLQPKLEFAHPSPLFGSLSVYKRLLSNDNSWLMFDKVTSWIKCLRNNMNTAQSKSTSTNDISTNGPYNDDNLQFINIENQSYENRLTNYTYNNMILSNITKI